MARRISLVLLIACAVLGVGCGGSKTSGPATSVTITHDFGAAVIGETASVETTAGLTALRQLATVHKLATGSGGRYVKSIDGTTEDGDSSWLFYVDGVESAVGSTSKRLQPGQVVQWDFHAWQTVRTGGAIVGAFPLPLKDGGVRLVCSPGHSPACDATRKALTASGISVAARARNRVVVGAWSDIEGFDGVRDLTVPGDTNGAYAQFSKGGRTLTPFSADGSGGRPIRSHGGLLAAFADAGAVVWLVTGTDPQGTQNAAGLLGAGAEKLRNRFAMMVGKAGPVALPEGVGE